jgi:hypothetical protein
MLTESHPLEFGAAKRRSEEKAACGAVEGANESRSEELTTADVIPPEGESERGIESGDALRYDAPSLQSKTTADLEVIPSVGGSESGAKPALFSENPNRDSLHGRGSASIICIRLADCELWDL